MSAPVVFFIVECAILMPGIYLHKFFDYLYVQLF